MKSPVHMKSPVDIALVHPRRKAGEAKLGKGTRPMMLTRSDIEKLMPHLRLSEASKQLGLSPTTVKKVCRKLGIDKWNNSPSFRGDGDDGRSPFSPDAFNGVSAPLPVVDVSASSLAASQSFLDNGRTFAWLAHSHTIEQASCMAPGSGVASGSGLGFMHTTSTAAAQLRVSVATPACPRSASALSSMDSGWSESTDGGDGLTGGLDAIRKDATPSCMPAALSSDMECDDDFVSIARCDPPLSPPPVADPRP